MKLCINFILGVLLLNNQAYAIEDCEYKIKELILENISFEVQNLEIFSLKPNNISQYVTLVDSVELTKLDEEKRTAQFNLFLEDGTVKPVSIFYDATISVFVSDKHMKSNYVIQSQDYKIKDIKISKLGNNFITNTSKSIVNMRVKKNLNKNSIIRDSDLISPYLVNANDIVDVIYQKHSLSLKMKALAINSGSDGETIKVKNINTLNVFPAKVHDYKIVVID